MPIFEIQTPDGKTFEVDAPDQGAAMEALSGMMQPKQPSRAGEWSIFNQAMDTVTGGLMMKGNAALEGGLDAVYGAVTGDGFNYSDNYNKSLERQRQAQSDYQTENPIRSGIGTGAGIALGVTNMPVIGKGFTGALKTGGAYGSIFGAGADADSMTERVGNTLKGGLTGAGIGAAGYGLGALAGKGAEKVSRAWQSINADPPTRAALQVQRLADDVGGPQAVQQALDDLGPESMAIDALGESGRALGRNVANINPAARETLEAGLGGRKAGQNQRIVSDMERLSGLPEGNTKTVDDLIESVDKQFRPGIDRLYSQARAAGKDIDLRQFSDILSTKYGKSVYNEALSKVQARAAVDGRKGDISNLAIIDEMKKIFGGRANKAFVSGDRATGAFYSDFEKGLRMKADAIMDSMEDPIYKEARAAAQAMNQAKDAVRMGETLGGPRVATNAPDQVQGIPANNRQRVAQGYVAKKSDTLLNRGSTEGALNELSTPMGKRAADAALGPDKMAPSLARERTFNQATRAVNGNSTTARQLAEMGLGTGAATWLMTGDPTTATIAGVLAGLTRKGVPAIAKKLATDSQRKTAPIIAQLLMQRGLPAKTAEEFAPAMLERLAKADREKMVRLLLMTALPHTQNTKPQTPRANQ